MLSIFDERFVTRLWGLGMFLVFTSYKKRDQLTLYL